MNTDKKTERKFHAKCITDQGVVPNTTTDAVKILKDRYGTKDTNPKDAIGTKKVPMHLMPTIPMMEEGLAFLEGARKYGAFNWRVSGVRFSVYYDAIMRHLNAFKEGEETDPDSGLCHLVKAKACLSILRDAQIMGNMIDDRPPRYPMRRIPMEIMNNAAGQIIDRYKDPVTPYTEKGLARELAKQQVQKACNEAEIGKDTLGDKDEKVPSDSSGDSQVQR